MKSFRRLQERLPAELTALLAEQYGPRDLDRVLAGFMARRPVTLRVNRLKTDVRAVMEDFRREGIKHERVLWYEDALILRDLRERDLEGGPLYEEGRIYLQSLSSMLPPLVLRPSRGMKILDLTAAPGSKSTQLAALMGNDGYILANEVNPLRAERLKYNVAKQSASIIEVRVGDGKRLEERWDAFFDAVLLDAPCSGLGLVCLDDPRTYRGWTARQVSRLAKDQRKLLASAVRALKPGGTLVYSTCTLAREENEDLVRWALEEYHGVLVMERIDLALTGAPVTAVECGGRRDAAWRILPNELYEGFFLARMKKRPGAGGGTAKLRPIGISSGSNHFSMATLAR